MICWFENYWKIRQLFENRSQHSVHKGKLIDDIPQKLLEDYSFISTLGEGAYGIVYKVYDKNDGNEYALKLSDYEADTEIEYKILSSVNHKNIIKY